jgi:hypothetical protein
MPPVGSGAKNRRAQKAKARRAKLERAEAEREAKNLAYERRAAGAHPGTWAQSPARSPPSSGRAPRRSKKGAKARARAAAAASAGGGQSGGQPAPGRHGGRLATRDPGAAGALAVREEAPVIHAIGGDRREQCVDLWRAMPKAEQIELVSLSEETVIAQFRKQLGADARRIDWSSPELRISPSDVRDVQARAVLALTEREGLLLAPATKHKSLSFLCALLAVEAKFELLMVLSDLYRKVAAIALWFCWRDAWRWTLPALLVWFVLVFSTTEAMKATRARLCACIAAVLVHTTDPHMAEWRSHMLVTGALCWYRAATTLQTTHSAWFLVCSFLVAIPYGIGELEKTRAAEHAADFQALRAIRILFVYANKLCLLLMCWQSYGAIALATFLFFADVFFWLLGAGLSLLAAAAALAARATVWGLALLPAEERRRLARVWARRDARLAAAGAGEAVAAALVAASFELGPVLGGLARAVLGVVALGLGHFFFCQLPPRAQQALVSGLMMAMAVPIFLLDVATQGLMAAHAFLGSVRGGAGAGTPGGAASNPGPGRRKGKQRRKRGPKNFAFDGEVPGRHAAPARGPTPVSEEMAGVD